MAFRPSWAHTSLARGAKGLVRKNTENIKIVQRSDLARISSQIRLWQLADQISCSPKIALEGIQPIVKAVGTVLSLNKLF